MEVKTKRKIPKITNKAIFKTISIYVLYFFGGFILSLGQTANGLKPFGISFVAISRKKGYIFSSLGAIIGYLIFGIDAVSTKYLCGILLAGLGAFLLEISELNSNPAMAVSLASISSLVPSIFVSIKTMADGEAYLVLIGEAVLTGIMAYFYYRSTNANFRQIRFKALPTTDLICIVISATTLFLPLAEMTIWLLYPIRIVAIMIVLFALRYGGEKYGILLSAVLGFTLGLSVNGWLFLSGALVISALISSLFLDGANLGISASFLSVIAIFSIFIGEDIGLSLFLDSFAGAIFFILTPPFITDKIESIFDKEKGLSPEGTLRQNLVLKLRFASSAMSAISDSVDQVREIINEATRKENLALRHKISQEEYITKEIILEKTNQIRMVASDQFISISGMLSDLAEEFGEAELFDSNASEKIRQVLLKEEIFPTNISAIVDKFGRMRVEILLASSSKTLSSPAFREEIGKACNRYFDSAKITNFKNDTMLSFFERPNYALEIGFAQHSAEGELCGDTVKIINDSKGHSILIISDGMGKGNRAALDGAMGAGLLSRLLNAGFGFDSALKVVNSALLVKSNDESLATLDIANIDLFTGKCELLKAGAPASFIIKNNRTTKCELTSMPAGILRGIEFARRTAVLSVGDRVVLMSDGITDLGDKWLMKIFSTMPRDIQECADYILESALKEANGTKIDDMSVIIARLERNE